MIDRTALLLEGTLANKIEYTLHDLDRVIGNYRCRTWT
jgi:hypothetical protein